MVKPMVTRTALVTGGNRGIGFEVCRQLAGRGLRVLLGARDPGLGSEAVDRLRKEGADARSVTLDVGRRDSIEDCVAELLRGGTPVDVLVNNAAVYPSGDLLEVAEDTLLEALTVNFLGPLHLSRALVPPMLRASYGRVVNITSGYGSFSSGLGGPAPYSLSKAALNALTLRLSSEVKGDVAVNAADPGWVKTRMGGRAAPRSVEQGADTIVWLATHPSPAPNGSLFRNRRAVPW